MKVNILGTEYTIKHDDLNNEELAESDGLCKLYDKEIILREKQYMCSESRYEHVKRHEIIHAVARECGVQYGDDEALVDWIAHIIPIVNNAIVQMNMLEFENDMKPGD